MRFQSAFHTAAATLTAATLLSACSSAPQTSSASLPQTAVLGNEARPAVPNTRAVHLGGATRTVYVAQQSQNNVLSFQYSHRTFTGGGAVSGAPGGYGLWIDKERNLYVGNYIPGAGKIFEYNELGDFVFTYSVPGSGVVRALTTDQYGNVFEADGDNSVSEFPSEVNAPIATCTPPGATGGVWGIAVDKQGDVFVDYADDEDSGNLMEYPHGLIASGCNGTQLLGFAPFSTAGGIALDPQKNLVICDVGASNVWIVSPPYTESASVTTFGSFSHPINVMITKKGTQALVTDLTYGVRLVRYPAGTTIATIANPPYAPTNAVDTDNYVP